MNVKIDITRPLMLAISKHISADWRDDKDYTLQITPSGVSLYPYVTVKHRGQPRVGLSSHVIDTHLADILRAALYSSKILPPDSIEFQLTSGEWKFSSKGRSRRRWINIQQGEPLKLLEVITNGTNTHQI